MLVLRGTAEAVALRSSAQLETRCHLDGLNKEDQD
jgi:hypothetical protein